MKKGTKVALVVMGALALVCVLGVTSLYQNSLKAIEAAKATAKPEGDTILILLTGNWDLNAIGTRTAPELEPKIRSGELPKRIAAWKEQFGALQSGEVQVTDFHATTDKNGAPKLVAVLVGRAKYEKGEADVTMTLTREPRNAWLLADFDLSLAK